MTPEIIGICEVCEEDTSIQTMVFVQILDSEPFAICEGCFENRPDDVHEVDLQD